MPCCPSRKPFWIAGPWSLNNTKDIVGVVEEGPEADNDGQPCATVAGECSPVRRVCVQFQIWMEKMAHRSRLFVLAVFVAVIVFVSTAYFNAVPSDIAAEDVAAARALMVGVGNASEPFERPTGFQEEIKLVLAVQDAVLRATPMNGGIELGESREISDLVRLGKGLCYDRSRAIETVLRLYGMNTRHASVYSTHETGSSLQSLITPQVSSHAVSEVWTEKGWLIIDSNARWIGLTATGEPYSLRDLREFKNVHWDEGMKDPINRIFIDGFTWIYGLYSRHGKFYAPYNSFPDVEWSEFFYNFKDYPFVSGTINIL